jgi:hypothetical protein
MVHHFKEGSLRIFIKSERNTGGPKRQSLQSSDRRDGPRRSGMEHGLGGMNVCVAARSKDTMSSTRRFLLHKNAVVELKYISAYKNSHIISTAPYAHCPERSYGCQCVLINCRTGECCRYVLTKSITEKSNVDVARVQSELQRISGHRILALQLEKFIGHHSSIVL